MEKSKRFYVLRAWCVHFYTSLGLIAGLLAMYFIAAGNPKWVFLLEGIALFIDSTDGTMARKFNVKKWTPHFDGRKLDDITDYLNYAFIPIYFALSFHMVTGMVGLVALGFVLLAAAYGFCRDAAKTCDGFFTGFPNFWNLLVFYLFFFRLPPGVNTILLVLFAVMIWVPIKYVSFSTRAYWKITYILSVVYGLSLLLIVWQMPLVSMGLIGASLLFPLYYVLISVYLTYKTRHVSIEDEEDCKSDGVAQAS
jgi:phosphatidylcholine synthase